MAKSWSSGALAIAVFIVFSLPLIVFRDEIIDFFTGFPGYIAIFLLAFVGALSIFVPIPYTAIIFALATTGKLDPIATALVGGLGSGLGEFSGWVMGRLVSKAIENTKYFVRVKALIEVLNRRGKFAVPLLIFLFALTPLPDDLLFVVLGMLRYSLAKALVAAIMGKTLMLFIITFSGRAISTVAEAYGVSADVVFIASIVALIVIMAIVMLVRWDELLARYLEGSQSSRAK